MSSQGNCFVVMPPNCATDTVILGRNAENESLVGVAQEVFYYDNSESLEGKTDLVGDASALRVILQKPKPGVWGGDCGSNERNLSVAITWSNDAESDLSAFDVVRLSLASAESAEAAVERVGELVAQHGHDDTKFSLIVCDPSQVWLISCAGKLWAAQQLTSGYHHLPSDGLAVTTTIDKSIEGLSDALKTLGCWDGEGDLNFAACFDCSPNSSTDWSGDEPSDDGSYSLTSMFETLRSSANAASSRSATVFVLCNNGISCHWFTATPNASESVFKPFVFAPQPKISPLTKVPADNEITLLHKLHGQRKPASLEHLKALEAACVEEVSAYLAEHPEVNEELDELMKDCVEAEVKFYR
ncbi:secernin-2 [Lucilia sericata]|uniref:secernin-2 n=1 Tax=Lucilia sericata TaxID=13632 RepID=UPI0018A7F8E6|nr:secernin-2 [Lucilia sericata]XP_037823225.1 secernin-2 [Lucilia sericata]